MYAIVKRYFDMGLYSAENVAKFVRAGKLVPEQYEQITGQSYEVI
ncbi:MAG: XkdX family protein [Anaerotignum sp.]|nr:XkdX family protein [Anaerotignum sp.]